MLFQGVKMTKPLAVGEISQPTSNHEIKREQADIVVRQPCGSSSLAIVSCLVSIFL